MTPPENAAADGGDLAHRYAERMSAPIVLTPKDQELVAGLLADDPVELVLRHHLPVRFPDDGPVLCLCDVTRTYDGPVYHRLHVVDELRKAGMLRD